MFLDKPAKAFVVDADNITHDKDMLRDRVDFADDADFEKHHTYYVKWRDCLPYCEELHLHSAYYPARILCLLEDVTALEGKSFRFPKIQDQNLSPAASLTSSQNSRAEDSGDKYPEYAEDKDDGDLSASEKEDEDDRESSRKARLKLSKAKLDIQKRQSLENVLKYREKHSSGHQQVDRTSASNVESNGRESAEVNLTNGHENVRKTRYLIVNGQYVINENLPIDVEVYDLMRLRPYKDATYFIRDAICLVWSPRELACHCLDLGKYSEAIPGLRLAEPEKIILVRDIVCNWYEDEKGIKITKKKRDKVY